MQKEEKLIQGRYYRVIKDVNCIPAGIYKFLTKEGACLFFGIGKKIKFMISDDGLPFIEYAPSTLVALHRTKPADFLERYYQLLALQGSKPPSFSGPFTGCVICQ